MSVLQTSVGRWSRRDVLLGAVMTLALLVAYAAIQMHNRTGYVIFGALFLTALAPVVLAAPRAVICIGAASTLAPVPARAPFAFAAGGGTLYAADLLVFAAFLVCLRREFRPRQTLCVQALSVFLAVGMFGALLNHPGLGLLGRDARGPLQLVFGVVIGMAAVRDVRLMRLLLRTLSVILWWAALAVAASVVTGLDLTFGHITAPDTLINNVQTTFASNRYQLDASNVAALVLAATITMLLLGQIRFRTAMIAFLIPSIFLTFESFSRNNLLALGAALLTALIVAVRRGSVIPTIFRLLTGTMLLIAAAIVVYNAISVTAGILGQPNPLAVQLATYRGRVLDVLSGANLQGDASAQFRTIEYGYAKQSFASSPLIGHGFGYQYRPVLPFDPFGLAGGTIYAHNWYGWVIAKVGIVGAVSLAIILLGPLRTALHSARSCNAALSTVVLVSTLCALAVMYVAPLPEAPGSSLYVGAVAGIGWGLRASMLRKSTGSRPPRALVLTSPNVKIK